METSNTPSTSTPEMEQPIGMPAEVVGAPEVVETPSPETVSPVETPEAPEAAPVV